VLTALGTGGVIIVVLLVVVAGGTIWYRRSQHRIEVDQEQAPVVLGALSDQPQPAHPHTPAAVTAESGQPNADQQDQPKGATPARLQTNATTDTVN
jgi:hypothetical protein